MSQYIAQIAIVIRDYNEAIQYYTTVLNFELIEDTKLSEEKRWVVVQPKGSNNGCKLMLAKAATPIQEQAIGNQNRMAVLGSNLLMLTHLSMIAYQLIKILNKDAELIDVEKTIGKFLPLYAAWTVIVVFLFPVLFGYK
jgi:hypothetical protein